MKKLNELTDKEAEEILDFYMKDKDWAFMKTVEGNLVKDYWFKSIEFESKKDDKGYEKISFGGKSIIGITYGYGQGDFCILYFTSGEVIEWLYEHDYDITPLIKELTKESEENYKIADGYVDVCLSLTIIMQKGYNDEKRLKALDTWYKEQVVPFEKANDLWIDTVPLIKQFEEQEDKKK